MAFDAERFFRTVDQKRDEEGRSWRQLAADLDLSPSTFSRMGHGRRPDIDTFLKVLSWLGRPAEDFMSDARPAADSAASRDTVADIGHSLRTDPTLRREDADALEQIVRVAYHRFRGG